MRSSIAFFRAFFKVSIWRVVFAAILLSGLAGLSMRFIYGLGGATNLSDSFPWGLWKGFNVVAGIGLGAGGFTVAATVHVFNLKRYRPILRIALLTAFLGYSFMAMALIVDIGRPYRIWHPVVMWGEHSVLFEVAWCVILYLNVLALELAPAICERFGWRKLLRGVSAISAPVVIFGVILSTLHQSSLGSLFLILPEKLYPLWYTPLLPVFFFVSAICAGLSMVIIASWQGKRALGKELELPVLEGLGRALAVVLMIYLCGRFLDLEDRGALPLLLRNRTETWLFALETGLLLIPMLLLFQRRVRSQPGRLYGCALIVILGFIANRLNVTVTGLEASSGVHYVPKWSEVSVTLSMVALAFALFRFLAQHFPIFDERRPVAPVYAEEEVPAGVG
jgi:Ni/Fe-hydrogenase subunit HybB-like protein